MTEECKDCGCGIKDRRALDVIQCHECGVLIRINRAAGARVPHWLRLETKDGPRYTRNEAHECKCGEGDCNDCGTNE